MVRHAPPDRPEPLEIGGGVGPKLWAAAKWSGGVAAVAAVLVGLFVRFGAPVAWATVLVGLMLGYMAAMSRWAGDGDDRWR